MRAYRWLLVLLACMVSTPLLASNHIVDDEVLVYISGNSTEDRSKGAEEVSKALGYAVKDSVPELGVFVFKVPAGVNDQILKRFTDHSKVKSADVHRYVQGGSVPNDTCYPPTANSAVCSGRTQDNLRKIQPETLWDRTQGEGIVVAVLDSGVNAAHEDLKGRVISGGYDFIADRPLDGQSNSDSSGHGTHIAGILGATMNNNLGIAGVAPKAKILPVRVLQGAGNTSGTIGTELTTIKGLQFAAKYAIDNNARVIINASFGSTANSNYCTAIGTLLSGAASDRIVIVAAAMNASGTAKHYPAACNDVIAVASVNLDDRLASTSNYGKDWVDFAAPGERVLSTDDGGGYAIDHGTSMATAFVSGAAALIFSDKRVEPSRVEEILKAAAVSVTPADAVDKGRVDLAKAGREMPPAPHQTYAPPSQQLPPSPPGDLDVQVQ